MDIDSLEDCESIIDFLDLILEDRRIPFPKEADEDES